MHIVLTSPDTPAARQLLAQADAYMQALYPPESNHLESVAALQRPNVAFFGCYVGDELAGCGAVKVLSDTDPPQRYGEIKRVFVAPPFRGRGVAHAIMQHLEAHLRGLDVPLARLETGISQPEALGLYRKLGYSERPPFGAYRPDPLSVFFEKRLR